MKQTPIKPGDDISGNCVTIDFNKLVEVAKIAAGKSCNAIRSCLNEIDSGLEEGAQTGNFRHAEYPVEGLERAIREYKVSVRVLHTLTALQEPDNRRETLYIYNLTQNCETLVQS